MPFASSLKKFVKPISQAKGFKMTKRVLALAIATITFFIAINSATIANADSIWSSPETLSMAGQSSNSPTIALNQLGGATAVWTGNDGSFSRIQASQMTSAGSWGPPVPISLAGQDSHDAKVVVDSTGLATAVWTGLTELGGWSNLQSSHSLNGGPWSTPVSVSNGINATVPDLVVDTFGRVVAIWHGYDGVNYHVQTSNSLRGGTWSTPVALGVSDKSSYWPKVAVDSAGATVAIWLQDSDTGLIVESSRSENGGSWSTASLLSVAGIEPSFPSLAIDSAGRNVAVWFSSIGGKNVIQSSTSLAGGSWSVPVNVSSLGFDSYGPKIAIDSSGRATLVWHQVNSAGHLVIEAATSISGGDWSTPLALSAPAIDSGDPLVSISGSDRAFVIWHSFDPATSTCTVQVTDSLNGGSWATAMQLGSCGDDISVMSLASTIGGRTFAAWDSNATGTNAIQSTSLNEPAPIIPAPSLASTGSSPNSLFLLEIGFLFVATGTLLRIFTGRRSNYVKR
jgi:hypothetical protein